MDDRHGDRHRRRQRSRSRDRDLRDRSRSRSRSRSPRRRRRKRDPSKKSNWDVAGPGIVLPAGSTVSVQNMQQQSIAFGGDSHGAKQARRLFIGGVTSNISEDMIRKFFDDNFRKADSSKDEVPMQVTVNHDKQFAFVEFSHPDDATAALLFDQLLIAGQPIRVKRPKDYTGTEILPAVSMTVSSIVANTPYKVFIGGLPTTLNEAQILELLMTFGDIKALSLARDSGGESKGYAFFEFIDHGVTDTACERLNNMTIGDKTLTVQRASQGTQSHGAALDAVAVPTGTPKDTASRVLVLLNLATTKQLQDPEWVEEIEDDVRDECSKYGNVLRVVVPMATKGHDHDPGVGKVFVEFESVEVARNAQKELAGRIFNSRMVITSFHSEDRFANIQYD